MSDVVTSVKEKIGDNEFGAEIPLGAQATYVSLSNGTNLQNNYDNTVDILTDINETLKQVTGASTYYRVVILNAASWTYDSAKKIYKYVISDANIVNNTLLTCYMDLDNQAKLISGYIESYTGGYTIYTSDKPSEEVTMYITMQKVNTEQEKIIGSLNTSGLEWTIGT